MQSGHIKLHAVIQSLGPFITDKDAGLRKQSIEALSRLLAFLPTNFLNETELGFILTFLCNRLKDHYSIVPAALRGVYTVVNISSINTRY